MTWTEPRTDWSNSNRFTCEDMNKITANINDIYPDANLKINYTQNDFLTATEWGDIQSKLSTLIAVTGLSAVAPGDGMTSDTFNEIGELTQRLKDRIALNYAQKVATIYAHDDLYPSVAGENWSRGVE